MQRGAPRDEDERDDRPRDDRPRGGARDEARDGDADGEAGEGARRRRRGRRGGRGRGGRAEGEAAGERTEGAERPERPEGAAAAGPRSGDRAERSRADGPREDRPRGRGRDGGGRDGGGRDGGRDGGRGRRFEDREPRGPFQEVDEDDLVLIPGTPDELPFAPSAEAADDVDLAGSTLRDVLTLLGYTGTEITARDPETPGDGTGLIEQIFDIYGEDDDTSDDLGVLIGRRGETLASLQYLVNTIVSKGGNKPPVFGIDIEGYRRRREQMLVDLAREIAQEVRETGDVITLEPMPAYERRIVHIALREEAGVKTESVGSGEHRQVEVMPE